MQHAATSTCWCECAIEAGGSRGVAVDENLGWDWLRDSAGEETVLFFPFLDLPSF
jgi:hypothetical protein